MSERSERELSGLKAAFYQHMEAQPSAVDSMDDFLLREYMVGVFSTLSLYPGLVQETNLSMTM